MWPLGHASGAFLLFDLWFRRTDREPDEVAVLLVAVGSVLPDLVDKPASWYLAILPTGRSLSHSLLFLIPLCALVGIVTWRRARPLWGIAFAIGSLGHVFLDALPAVWEDPTSIEWLLFPLLPVQPYPEGPPTILGLLMDSLQDPFFYLEFVLFAFAFRAWQVRGYPGWTLLRKRVPDRSAG